VAKFDLKAAYRHIPVHPDDRRLLGMEWKGGLYLDATLPFGLRSAPVIFNAVAEALAFVIRERGVEGMDHYLDDYTCGKTQIPTVQEKFRGGIGDM